MNRTALLAACLIPAGLLWARTPPVPARVETFARDDVRLVVRAEPAHVPAAADLLVTFELTHPERLEVRLPERFDDRFEGFRIEGFFEGEAVVGAGVRQRTWHLRARPLPAAERYRIAPFPVQIRDRALTPPRETWFPTRAIVLEPAPLLGPEERVPEGVTTGLRPFWVRPSGRTIARWAGSALLAILCAGLLVWAGCRLRRRVRLARMAPRERALLELRELLARDLPGKGRVKEFYVALTFVIRRYIERRHGIRAPEQTTEEFLREASRHPAFATATLARLRAFLSAADLVKFAGVTADTDAIRLAVAAARDYLEREPADTPRGAKDGAA